MTAQSTKLGPGLLTVGEVGSEVDMSCQLSAAKVEADKDKEDDTPVLCGDVIPGSTEYTWKLSGTVAQDLKAATGEGIVEFSWAHRGEAHPFVFVPATDAGKQVTGIVIVDPLMIGGDEVKKNMMSDFEWDIVGDPVLGTYTPPLPGTRAVRRTREPLPEPEPLGEPDRERELV